MRELGPHITIGRYRLVERLDAGGMGVVYKAVTEDSPRPVVIKQVLPAYSRDSGFVDMLLSEARLGELLKHPSIVQIFELGQSGGEYYLAMEYIDGFNLTAVLRAASRQRLPVPASVAVHIVCQLLSALGYAHSRCDDQGRALEIVHRDVSPSNIMLTRSGAVKLVDFGIAKAVNQFAADVTTSGHIKGKLGYLAPEQVRHQRLDRRTDIYALGIVFHELLTMERLFGGRDVIDVMRRLMEACVPPPSSLCADVSPELDAAVLKMLALDPSDRYGSCEEVLEALRPLQHTLGGDAATLRAYLESLDPIESRPQATASMPRPSTATSMPPPPTLSAPRRRRPRQRKKFLAVLALGGLLPIAAGVGVGMVLACYTRRTIEPAPQPLPAMAAAPHSRRLRRNRVGPQERPTPLGRTFHDDDIKDPSDR